MPRLSRALLMSVVAMCACGGSDPAGPTRIGTIAITPPSATVVAGSTQLYTSLLRSDKGEVLTGRSVTWTSSNASVATIDGSGLATAVSPGTATITASSGDRSAPASITVLQAPVASIVITPLGAPPVAATTFQLTATTRDARGNALANRAVTWTSGNGEIATVSSAGLVTALTPGTVTFTASSEGQSGTLVVTVLPAAVASVNVSARVASMSIGSTQQLIVVLRDTRGTIITDRTPAWSTNNAAVATISGSGLVTGISTGTAVLTATIDGASGSASVLITPAPPAPIVSSVLPATVSPGATLTISGSGFDPALSNNTVIVRGAAATILTATATQLTVSAPCVESGPTSVRVSSRGVTGEPASVVMSVPQRTLAVGQSLVLTANSESLCNELVTAQPSARYLVTAFSASTGVNTLADLELAGSTPVSVAAQPAVRYAPTATMRLTDATMPASMRDEAARDAARDAAHWQMLERNRQDYERGMQRARTSGASLRATRAAAPLPRLGDMRSLYFTYTGGCNDTTRVMRGKMIYVGTRAVIWEDSANALQSATDASLAGYYERLGRIFDQDQYDAVKNTFGDPLLRDAITDNDARVHMVFSSRVNGTTAAAYVTSCDQFPTSTYRGSNIGEFFYGFVPTTAGSNINNTAMPDGWFSFMSRTIVHEVKHIASLSARVANASPNFEQSWLEEGTARHAEEVWVRESLHRVAWKANSGFGTAASNGIYCDFLPGDAPCLTVDPLRRPSYGMRRQFNEIRDKLVQPWNWSPYGEGTGQSGAVFYNTAWSLVRYTIDRYAASDASFFRTLINSTSTGTANLSATAGVSMEQLIGGWGLALFADDYPGIASPSADMQFPTWNLRSIYSGLFDSPTWNPRFNTPFPILPTQLEFGPFVSRVTGLRGGAHAYFEIAGAARATQLLNLRGLNGATPSPNLRLAIARLQ